MRRSVLALCLLVGISCDPAPSGYETKDDLVSAFVAAVNGNDVDQLRRTVHPACTALISEPTEAYYDDLFEKDLKYTVPADYTVLYSSVPDDQAQPFEQQFDYPVRPTDGVTIDFKTDEYSSVSIMRWLRQDERGWHLVLPHPKEATLVLLQEQRTRKKEMESRAHELVESMEPELRSKVLEHLRGGQMLDAIQDYEDTTGESIEMAVSVVKKIKAAQSSR